MTEDLFLQNPWIILILLWTLPWKGVALWRAAKKGKKGWFIALLVFNTLAVLEILYLFVFSRKGRKEEGGREEEKTGKDLGE